MADQQRIKRLYPFLRRSPRIDTPETITITETIVESRFQTYGGPYISVVTTRSKFVPAFVLVNPFVSFQSFKSFKRTQIFDTTTDFFVISTYSTALTAATP